MASISPDLHALDCKNCSQMVNLILVELENGNFWIWFLVFGFCFFPNENQLGSHMRYRLFLHHGWFVQNLGKDSIPTNMHTTVHTYSTLWMVFKKFVCQQGLLDACNLAYPHTNFFTMLCLIFLGCYIRKICLPT
jgi:hypothetical protein